MIEQNNTISKKKIIKICYDRIIPSMYAETVADNAIKENKKNIPLNVFKGSTASIKINAGVYPQNFPIMRTMMISRDVILSDAMHKPKPENRLEKFWLALITGKIWQNGRTLTIGFLNGSEDIQEKVKQYANQWTNYANIKFDFISDSDAEIRIAFKWNGDTGSWSYIGTDALSIPKEEPTMNFGWLESSTPDDEYSRVVTHEFGHMLGCIHEHQNPSGGINWKKEAVYAKYGGPPNYWSKEDVDHNLFETYDKNITQYTYLDPNSIMLYPIPAELTTDGFSVGLNKYLSSVDKSFIKSIYPFGEEPTDGGEEPTDGGEEPTDGGEEPTDGGEEPTETETWSTMSDISDSNGKNYTFNIENEGKHILQIKGPNRILIESLNKNNDFDPVGLDNNMVESLKTKMIVTLKKGKYRIRIRPHLSEVNENSFSLTRVKDE